MKARAVNNWYKSNELILTYLGEFETLNFSIGVLPEDIALFHALYRTSIKGRKDIISIMFNDKDENGSSIENIDSSYTSRVAEIFNVILRSLGIELEFIDDDSIIKTYNDEIISNHELNGHTYMCTDYQFFLIERTEEIRREILAKTPILTESKLKELTEETLRTKKYINGPLSEELGNLQERVDEECRLDYERLIDSLRKETEEIIENTEEEQVINITK